MSLWLPLLAFTLLGLLIAGVLRLAAAAPDESAPAPRPSSTRRAAGPPADPADRLWARLTVCRREGHDWTIAWPVGRRMRQCRACGRLAEPTKVVVMRRERLS